MQLFFLPNLSKNDKVAEFDKEESKHIFKVLRKGVGDRLNITNGLNYFFEASISSISKNHCKVDIKTSTKGATLSYGLHIAISPLKSMERFEWFLEKSSEIGISEITPIICDRTEKKHINEKRLKKVLVSAMKQSLKSHLPLLNPVTSLKEFLNIKFNEDLFIAHCEKFKKTTLLNSIKSKSSNLILIGPEGDFSETEINLATAKGFKNVSLGDTRFRTETAGIIACHTVSIVNM
ncbi:MAG: 16S rRNA (uracil(1498)-N(3))-methyltransferase [Bacteroidetes bacterium]|jgi:16S rRNA (uracil1498-N3)-methyltransferase|nr:MAG: 16S rRNA methyltransferase [Cryomorphaceae bacterium BACL29 MAG-121220-bin8]MDA0758543.1 16S rRNA (uracil(1498)-N(3))-methyltransferase [Bacteroidota bacterium]MDA1019053.1 16S rRNA (uracil(1498)-N(3))-methyltransferase [Bacteroidota bacterium]